MVTNETINAAHTVAIHMLESNAYISQDDTVCALRARSGRVFTGISRQNGQMGIHAEVDAIQNMQAAGDFIVDEMVLISTQTRIQLLPCNNCISYILSLHPENANCAVLMPDRAIRLTDVGMFANPASNPPFPPNGGMYSGNPMMGNAAPPPVFPVPPVNPVTPPANPVPPTVNPVSPVQNTAAFDDDDDADDDDEITATSENASSDLLKKRVNSLLRVASDEDEEIDKLTDKKKRFGFFRK
jgi:cytidine deaminase